jgi:hypothetical protein
LTSHAENVFSIRGHDKISKDKGDEEFGVRATALSILYPGILPRQAVNYDTTQVARWRTWAGKQNKRRGKALKIRGSPLVEPRLSIAHLTAHQER